MRGWLDLFIYYATAPIRLFGRSRRFRLALGALAILAICFTATLWALNRLAPADSGARQAVAKLPALPPLPPVTRASYVIAPVAVALTAIRANLDAGATRELGVTNNLVRRVHEHREGLVPGFTKRYGLKMLVYFEQYDTPHAAIQREEEHQALAALMETQFDQGSEPAMARFI